MILLSGVEAFKAFAEMQAQHIPGGAVYGVIEGDTITWELSSEGFSLQVFKVGNKISSEGGIAKAIKEKRTTTEKIPRSVYGQRVIISSTPIVNEEGKAVGAVAVAFPRLHPVAAAFNKFAPVLAKTFPEGALLYVTDLQKVVYRQSSQQFDITAKQVGDLLNEGDIAVKTIKTKETAAVELDAGWYGVPVYTTSVPLFDEEDETEIVATFGIIVPKTTALQLRGLSERLETGLSGISSAIQELAASASQIHTNELALNNDIKEVMSLSEEINEISLYIKEIADETKMLGLNAAIEAARAGDAGRGFGVVSEEIRKLSDQSKSTVPKIKKLTDDIKEKVNDAGKKGNESMISSQEQAAATEEITASIEEISSMAAELNNIAQKI